MAYTSGTAANYKDLLAALVTFATANGWVALEQSETQVYLKGTGLAGLDEIYVGIETYEIPTSGIYNWTLYGSWGYRAEASSYSDMPHSFVNAGVNYTPKALFWNNSIPYWMVANGRRIILFAKVGTTYQSVHLGLLTPPATDAQYPYPLLIGGAYNSSNGDIAYSSTSAAQWWLAAAYSRLHLPDGRWGCAYGADRTEQLPPFRPVTPYGNEANMLTAPDGSYLLQPIYMISYETYPFGNVYGQVEGLFRVSGINQTSENIITVDGVNYMAFQYGSYSGIEHFCALRLN